MYSSLSRDPGGVQTVFAALADRLTKSGYAVTKTWSSSAAELSEDEWFCPLEVVLRPPGAGFVRSVLGVVRSLIRLAVGLAKRRPHVVNVHFLSGESLYFLLLRPVFQYKLVLSAHGSDILRPTQASRRVLPHLLRSADGTTVVSRNLRKAVISYTDVARSKLWLVRNQISLDFWSQRPLTEEEDAHSRPTIVAVGRMEYVKGFDVLLRAFAQVRGQIPDARLVIVGDGSLRPDLEREAATLLPADAVEFPGFCSPAEVRSYLHQASVFALPSRSEGMPIALMEAMAAGVPVVAARVGGVAEVLTPGTGLLVASEAADELAVSLLTIMANKDLAVELAANARRRVRELCASNWDLYDQIFKGLVRTRYSRASVRSLR
jgi:glycosyltransferase involved in cell wall biosynthesis